MGPISNNIVEYILQNKAVCIILTIVFTVIYLSLDLFGRNYYIKNNKLDDGSRYSLQRIMYRDIRYVICTTIFLAVPFAIYFYAQYKKITLIEGNVDYFLIYLVIALIVISVVRKDPIFVFIWVIGPGDCSGWIYIILFILKLAFSLIYLIMMLVANCILSIVINPILYLILIFVNCYKIRKLKY